MSTVKHKDLAAGRQEKVARILRRQRIVHVEEFSAKLGVSPATVRRDLAEMEEMGLLTRVHGGAVSAERRLAEPVFDDKEGLAASQKQAIAEAAAQFVKPNDSVFLDGGSTVLALARLLTAMTGITVVTNSLRVAGTFSGAGPRMILVGGEFRRLSQTFVGTLTEPIIQRLHVDTAFIGTIGLSPDNGMTTTDPREAHTKELVMAHARQVILLADSSKMGKLSFVEFGSLSAVNVLITDSSIAKEDARAFQRKGVRLLGV